MSAMIPGWGRVGVAVVLVAGLTAFGQPAPSFACQGHGAAFLCTAKDFELFELIPEWTLHTPKPKSEFGITFFQKRAPKDWTILEMKVRLNDQPESPQKVRVYILYTWVRLCPHKKAVFAPVINPWGDILDVVKRKPPKGDCSHVSGS